MRVLGLRGKSIPECGLLGPGGNVLPSASQSTLFGPISSISLGPIQVWRGGEYQSRVVEWERKRITRRKKKKETQDVKG